MLIGGLAWSAEEAVCVDAEEADPPAETDEPVDTDEPLPQPQSAQEVLQGTLARLPAETVSLEGQLIVRRQRGVVLREAGFVVELAWGEDPPRACYRLLDTFGRERENLTVLRRPDGTSDLVWRDAAGAVRATPPSLAGLVQETDLAWMDLTLAFLWWPDARLDGEADFRGSKCDIVRVKPPEPLPGCGAVRLWVDRRLRFLRQAEQIDESGQRVRRMWVSSVGKIGDRWMIRNLEVERPGSGQRTKLHVERLTTP